MWVNRVRTRRKDRSSISSHPLADLGGKQELVTTSLLSPYRCSSFVRAMRPFLRPGLHILEAARAGAVKAGRSLRPPEGLGLDGSEHGATLKQVGMTSRVSSHIRSCARC